MGSDSHYQIPAIDFSSSSTELNRGTEEWRSLCKRVREACENYGCFEIVYDKIPPHFKAETFSMIRQLFDLPSETKKKYVTPKPFVGYFGHYPNAPLYETFGIDDSSNHDSFNSFTELMWPNGHDSFSNTLVTMTKKLEELGEMIKRMILDSYGLGEKSNTIIPCNTVLRVIKYTAPSSREYTEGIMPHTDKMVSTILCEDQVSGLEYETKDGQWVKLSMQSPTSYLFIVGDHLMAWSNGRMDRLKHRVMMAGEKDRYSMAAFTNPLEGTIIKAADELVDEEHPRILKDYDYSEFGRFTFTKEGSAIDSDKQVFEFAGISLAQ